MPGVIARPAFFGRFHFDQNVAGIKHLLRRDALPTPNLNDLFNQATKLAGAGGTKGTTDPAVADQLLAKIDEIAAIFWETKKA